MSRLPVLVADDDRQMRSLMRTVLIKRGFQVVEAVDGARALAALESTGGAFCLLVSDCDMPGLDGIGLAKAVRERFSAFPILLVSGAITEVDSHLADAFLAEPFLPSVMTQTVSRLLAGVGVQLQ